MLMPGHSSSSPESPHTRLEHSTAPPSMQPSEASQPLQSGILLTFLTDCPSTYTHPKPTSSTLE